MEKQITVKGIFLIQTLRLLKNKFPNETEQLQQKLSLTNIQPFNDYPVSLQVEIEAAGCKLLFPHKGEDAYLEFGRLSFRSFAENLVGKILFTLIGKSVKILVLSSPRFWGAVTTGIHIETKVLSENKISVRFYNNPYTIQGIKGVFVEGLDYLHINGTVTSKAHNVHDHEYIIEWDKNNSDFVIPDKKD